MNETPIPHPVLKTDGLVAAIVLALTQLNPVAEHFGWWHFGGDDLSYVTQLVGLVFSAAVIVKGWLVHNRVTPNERVLLRTDEAPAGIVAAPAAELTPKNTVGE
jgi:hypothetical protein